MTDAEREFHVTNSDAPGNGSEPSHAPAAEVKAAPQDPKESAEPRGFLRGAISAFILFHLIVISCYAIPWGIAPVRDVKELALPYLRWSGLFQSWDFFAPNPKSVNNYLEADVITQKHHQKVWVFPRMEQLSYGERYRKERYRKFAEVLPLQINAPLWPGVAEHVARIFASPTDPPAMVLLIQFQAPINLEVRPSPAPIPQPRIFYEYENLPPEDLK